MKNTQTHAEVLDRLIATMQDVVPYLQQLSRTERFALQAEVQTLWSKYNGRHPGKEVTRNNYTYHETGPYRYSDQQRLAVDMLAVCCCKNITSFRELVRWNTVGTLLNETVIERIYPWYVPKWFNKEVNTFRSNHYLLFLELEEKGYFKPEVATLASLLPQVLIDYQDQVGYTYNPTNLERYPVTLEAHLWYLFEEPTTIHNTWTYSRLRNHPGGEGPLWFTTFNALVKDGKVDRMRVLRSCLLACTKGFNQTLTGWFYKLFAYLEPTEAELLALQPELLTGLQAPSGKAVNASLGYLKQLITRPTFDVAGFASVVPQLLQSETKTTVRTTLQLVEKLGKAKQLPYEEIAQLATVALAGTDVKLQQRAAKLIVRYGDASDATLATDISSYADLLTTESRSLLDDYLTEAIAMEEALDVIPYTPLAADNAIAYLTDVEALVFFVSRALDTEDALDLELLLVHLPRLEAQMTAAHAHKLDGVLTRALQRVWYHGGWGNEVSDTAAFLLNDYADYLLRRYPESLPGRSKLLTKLQTEMLKHTYATLATRSYPYPVVQLVAQRFIDQQADLVAGTALEPLSLPTHYPAWVSPTRLIERLLAHERAGKDVSLIDWQLALFRLPLTATLTDEDQRELDQLQATHRADVLRYGYGQVPLDLNKHRTPDSYLPLVIARRQPEEIAHFEAFTGRDTQAEQVDFAWAHRVQDYEGQDYDRKSGGWITKTMQHKVLTLTRTAAPDAPSLIERRYGAPINRWRPDPTTLSAGLFRRYRFDSKDGYLHLPAAWGRLLALLTPNHPAQAAGVFLRRFFFNEELMSDANQVLVQLLTGLHESWQRAEESEVVYLLLGAGSLTKQKVTRQLVAELWIDAVAHGAFNSARFGRIVGQLLATEFAPPKRFTDLLLSMDRLGPLHDAALLELLGSLLSKLPNKPITNLRKLLELYAELRVRTGAEGAVPIALAEKLNAWKAVKSLKKVVDKLGQSVEFRD